MQYLCAASKMIKLSWFISKSNHLNITVFWVYDPTTDAKEAEADQADHESLRHLLELTPKEDVFFLIGDWNAKVGIQEIPGISRFGFVGQN